MPIASASAMREDGESRTEQRATDPVDVVAEQEHDPDERGSDVDDPPALPSLQQDLHGLHREKDHEQHSDDGE